MKLLTCLIEKATSAGFLIFSHSQHLIIEVCTKWFYTLYCMCVEFKAAVKAPIKILPHL